MMTITSMNVPGLVVRCLSGVPCIVSLVVFGAGLAGLARVMAKQILVHAPSTRNKAKFSRLFHALLAS